MGLTASFIIALMCAFPQHSISLITLIFTIIMRVYRFFKHQYNLQALARENLTTLSFLHEENRKLQDAVKSQSEIREEERARFKNAEIVHNDQCNFLRKELEKSKTVSSILDTLPPTFYPTSNSPATLRHTDTYDTLLARVERLEVENTHLQEVENKGINPLQAQIELLTTQISKHQENITSSTQYKALEAKLKEEKA